MSPLVGDHAVRHSLREESGPYFTVSAAVSSSSSFQEGSLQVRVWCSQPSPLQERLSHPGLRGIDQKSLI